ncbi:recombinase family protein [Agrobacterium tumefaciens]|uniref:Recombinase family protein n=1 Tax=Agrobacterium tumefaciens TaxID=358 RepID=A0AAJ4TC80_AGRTU|nr:recombinase family protein [Agrobacterium tumefaciens]
MTVAYSYVRISTFEQSEGSGVERQLEKTRRYAEENGLILDTEMIDIGKSGFHGRHKKDGVFGEFIDLVKEGKIKRGSVLIVESLDRISREKVIVAAGQLLSLLGEGIDVVTLQDRMRYSSNATVGDLIVSLTIMSRAHEESAIKSDRVKAAIEKRKEMAVMGLKTFVQNGPSWIDQERLKDRTYRFTLNHRADVIRRIFDLYLDGYGLNKICQIFNAEKVKNLSRATLWKDNILFAVLRNEATIGTYQAGETSIKDYFPACITEDMFWRAQDELKKRSKPGRKGVRYTNLFQGLIVCHHCGNSVMTTRSGVKGMVHTYFACRTTSLGGECKREGKRKQINLKMVEKAVLDNVLVYHLDSNIGKKNTSSLVMEKELLVGSIEQSKKAVRNLMSSLELVDDEDDRVMLTNRITTLRKEERANQSRLEVIEGEIRSIESDLQDDVDINKEVRAEIAKWPNLGEAELYQSRQKINNILRKLITQVRIDIDAQEINVVLAGMIKWWNIDIEGKVLHTGDWSMLPFDILVKRAKEFFGKSVDVASMKSVYDRIEIARPDPKLWDGERNPDVFPSHLN